MFNIIKYKSAFAIYFLIMAVLLEISTFILLGIGVIPAYYLYDFGLMLIIAGLIFLVPSKIAQMIISLAILIGQTLLIYVNYSLTTLYGDVFTFDMIKLFTAAFQAMGNDFTFVRMIIFLVIIDLAIIAGAIWLFRKLKKDGHKVTFHSNLTISLVVVLCIISGYGLISTTYSNIVKDSMTDEYVLTDKFLIEKSIFKLKAFKKFGTYGFYLNGFYTDLRDSSDDEIQDAIDFLNSTDICDESEVYGVDTGNNVIFIMMESLEWFAFSDGSFNSKIISNELTPNIYNLIYGFSEDTAKNFYGVEQLDDYNYSLKGYASTSYFSKSKTNISEGGAVLGSYPVGANLFDYANEKTNNVGQYGFSLMNILDTSNYDYVSSYAHSNVASFYSRDDSHKVIGFDNLYFKDTIPELSSEDMGWGNWMSEEEFMLSFIDDFIPDVDYNNNERFFSFYLNVSTHGNYDDVKGIDDRLNYTNLVKNSNWYQNVVKDYFQLGNTFLNRLVNYEASVVGLDRAIGVIIKNLLEKGIYDETTIVLFSDHNAYYHELSNDIKGVENSDFANIELNTVPFIIKSSGLARLGITINDYNNQEDLSSNYKYFDRFCSVYDILPSVLDLLGIEYLPSVYLGKSLFSEFDSEYVPVYYSHTGGMFGKYGYTDDLEIFNYELENIDDYKQIFEKSCLEFTKFLTANQLLYSDNLFLKLKKS